MICAGIDIGSLTAECVLVDEGGLVASSRQRVQPNPVDSATAVLGEALADASLEREALGRTVATGYGREKLCEVGLADEELSEISCHGFGVFALRPTVRTIVDIGGQDAKVIRVDERGDLEHFAMNDKCAAGTGRFLEAMARAMEVDLDDFGDLDRNARGNLTLSSMCTVFAESEVVSLVADGEDVPEIVRGLHRAVAARTRGLVKRVAPKLDGLPVAMSGGVARNPGAVRALSEAIGAELRVPEEPDTVGALGAALIARDRANR